MEKSSDFIPDSSIVNNRMDITDKSTLVNNIGLLQEAINGFLERHNILLDKFIELKKENVRMCPHPPKTTQNPRS